MPPSLLNGTVRYSVVSAGIISVTFVLYLFCFPNSQPLCPPQYAQTVPLPEKSSLSEAPKSEKTPPKPIVLLWFWPENFRFSFSDCKTLMDIDGCSLTDDRSLYSEADAVLIFHKSIKHDSSNLPPSPRPPAQRWIWFHVESPTNTIKIPGLENLFNLTLSYRLDSDILVRYQLFVRETPEEHFEMPRKDKLVCWIVSNNNPYTGTGLRTKYFNELRKYIKITLFGKAYGSFLKYEDYYPTISSCKFYLAFENSIHRDYITEKFNAPLAAGTVPVVLGPPRQNYENFAPSNAFIHVDDFPTPKELAEYLLRLDKDDNLYRSYFQWRRHLEAKPHFVLQNQEFIKPICTACDYIGKHNEYRAPTNIYKWYFS
ncbi:4-galactosyl-N-acetylglucosaminide 3-alpha-L-fucosyltransferase 9-like [Astyanax mexicanus]|uniref:4-galactosyl-N-acetylglucosaminide 3-alpha-L-fucosyltransferase 9-like n=1 Tax=Astyanax mexicanus TaxID=7994 RepID=UPI0020CB41FD|nr:4-galactosyl-N-acetylglucosaminide 3-alpha-L-fucosyltransferase 9-like [Astyanax mexicanus]